LSLMWTRSCQAVGLGRSRLRRRNSGRHNSGRHNSGRHSVQIGKAQQYGVQNTVYKSMV
jgi:hypothetical protein